MRSCPRPVSPAAGTRSSDATAVGGGRGSSRVPASPCRGSNIALVGLRTPTLRADACGRGPCEPPRPGPWVRRRPNALLVRFGLDPRNPLVWPLSPRGPVGSGAVTNWAETLAGFRTGDLDATNQIIALITRYLASIGAFGLRDSWDDLVQEVLGWWLRRILDPLALAVGDRQPGRCRSGLPGRASGAACRSQPSPLCPIRNDPSCRLPEWSDSSP
jgi:hypothetical protein